MIQTGFLIIYSSSNNRLKLIMLIEQRGTDLHVYTLYVLIMDNSCSSHKHSTYGHTQRLYA